MSFRNRPVLDRKHRPRWQDELRTQQLLLSGFAVAIALAVGIFGATTWVAYWDAHLRPVASVAGERVTRSDLAVRESTMRAELLADAADLQSQQGGPLDAIIEQQLQSISLRLSGLAGEATDSLVNGTALASRADELGLAVSEDELTAEIAARRSLPERASLQMILVSFLPDGAEPDAEPTDEQREVARAEAEALVVRLEAGEDFATLATESSDDFTAQIGGALGWVEDGNVAYDAQFDATRDAAVGERVGPIELPTGWGIIEVLDRRPAAPDEALSGLLSESGVDEAAYREFVRDDLLMAEYRTYFADEVVAAEQPQQRVAQIYIAPLADAALPQVRVRHVLIAPLPEAEDQTAATEEQWAAALAEAEAVREQLAAEAADWFAIAEEQSDDTGSGARGGDLGWVDPQNTGFVEEFSAALTALEVGGLSEPVRTQFGYHVIQKTAERTSPQGFATELVTELRAAPETFAEVASRVSEDPGTAAEGGELGWVARYQLEPELEEAAFALDEVDEISEPVDLGDGGIYIFKLLESSESREVDEERLEQIRASGFDRWLADEVKAPVEVWVDPEFTSTTAA